MSLVKHKYKKGVETLRIGTVKIIYTWNGNSKKPTVTYSTAPHTIPEEGSLNSIMSGEVIESHSTREFSENRTTLL